MASFRSPRMSGEVATTLTAATCSRGPTTASAVRIISSASLPCVASTTPIMGRNLTQDGLSRRFLQRRSALRDAELDGLALRRGRRTLAGRLGVHAGRGAPVDEDGEQ